MIRAIRLTAALLLLGTAACTTTPGDSNIFMAYQPTTGPFPYNSFYCP